ncbi:MAG: ERF family protein [Lachnospiraceae bacterium]|nr:ERF family protein [Lachnospiraceae bacterium]
MTIQEKLLHIQQNLKAPKNQYNSFGDYHYRSCEDIQNALKPLLEEVKAVVLLNDDIVQIGDRYYIKATAILQDVESPDGISNTAYARETEQKPKMDTAQITGSCSSYARKYALNGLFLIDDSKIEPSADPDTGKPPEQPKGNNRQQLGQQGTRTTQNRQQGATQKPSGAAGGNKAVYVTQAQINTIRAEIGRTGAKEKAVCYQYRIDRLQDMAVEQFKNAMLIFSQMQSKEPEPDYMGYEMTLEEMAQYETDMPFR